MVLYQGLRPMQGSNPCRNCCQLWQSPEVWMPNIPNNGPIDFLDKCFVWVHSQAFCFSDVKKIIEAPGLVATSSPYFTVDFIAQSAWRKAVQHATPGLRHANKCSGKTSTAISGTDSLEVPTIYKAYFSGLCKEIYPQNMARNMVLTNLHFRVLKFSLTCSLQLT